jgi:hypothetical protein
MNSHLNEEQFAEWLLETNDRETAQHLAACSTCRAEGESLRNAIDGYRESACQTAERDEAFWARQRLAIHSRSKSQRFVPYFRWAAATVMVLVVIAAFVLTRSPQPAQRAKNDLSDDALLQQVENSLDRGYPAALAPAMLIDQERSRALSSASTPKPADAFTTSKQKEQQQ